MAHKRVPFKPYEARSEYESGYVRLTQSLLGSDAYRDLEPSTILIYIDMRKTAKGHTRLVYTQRMAYEHLGKAKATFTRALDELEQVGLIRRCPRSCYAPTTIEFSADWQKYVSPNRDPLTGEYQVSKPKK